MPHMSLTMGHNTLYRLHAPHAINNGAYVWATYCRWSYSETSQGSIVGLTWGPRYSHYGLSIVRWSSLSSSCHGLGIVLVLIRLVGITPTSLAARRPDLVGILGNATTRKQEVGQHVQHHGAPDVPLLSQAVPDHGAIAGTQKAAQDANDCTALAEIFGIVANLYTRQTEGKQADTSVQQAAKQAVGPLVGHDDDTLNPLVSMAMICFNGNSPQGWIYIGL